MNLCYFLEGVIKWGFICLDPGKNNKNFIITNPEYSYTESIVLKVLSKHENKGYRIFFDSWYSSISLNNILTKKGFQVISTLRLNAKNFPDKTSLENSSKNMDIIMNII